MTTAAPAPATVDDERIEITSYRDVFDLERRIYRVDRLRLNPGGIPLRGVVYFGVVALAVALLAAIPVVGVPVALMPWYLRWLAAPGVAATLACAVRVSGRPLHLACSGLALRWLRPRQLSGFSGCPRIGVRWRHPPVIVIADGSQGRPRRMRCTGPGVVLVRCPHRLRHRRTGPLARALRRPDLSLYAPRDSRPLRDAARAVALAEGARLELVPTGRRLAPRRPAAPS